MANSGLQILGFALSLLGLVGLIVGTILPQWKMSAYVGDNIITAVSMYQGLWMSCAFQSTGQIQCKVYDSILQLDTALQATRALMIVGIIVTVAGLGVATMGMKCTNCGGDDKNKKSRIAMTGGIVLLIGSLCATIACSWYANNIIKEFYNPFAEMWTLCLLCVCLPWSSCRDAETAANVAAEGRAALQRVRNLAAQPRYGECWSNALENIDARCKDFTVDMQSRIALLFTHCHLRKSDRPFPACPEGSEVSSCTRSMDPVAFNAYTEFFTHAHSICRHLQSESWQHQAENTIHRCSAMRSTPDHRCCAMRSTPDHRLTESSAGVVEQLSSTQRMAESLMEAQSVALKSQETILRNGEELKHTLHHSTQGLRAVFDEMRLSTQEQQVAFSEIFNRVAFLQSFIMSESHTLTSLLYNSLGFLAAFFLTSTQRTAPARFVLFGLVVLNVYLERMLCRAVLDSSEPGYQQMEQISLLVGLLRRAMVLVGLLALVYVAVRYRNVTKESLEILTQLKETRTSLQLALQQAECLSEAVDRRSSGARGRRSEQRPSRRKENKEENSSTSDFTSEKPYMTHTYDGWQYDSSYSTPGGEETSTQTSNQNQRTLPSPARPQRRSSVSRRAPASPLVYSILVEDKQTRYNLRNRRSSVSGLETERGTDMWLGTQTDTDRQMD